MLQHLENIYLAILRSVIIIAAGLLLGFAIIFGLGALKLALSEPQPALTVPAVADSVLTAKLAAAPVAAPAAIVDSGSGVNDAAYARAAKTVANFIDANSAAGAPASQERIGAVLKAKAQAQGEPLLVSAFANNLADALAKTLSDPAVIAAAKSATAADIVNRALDEFSAEFKLQRERGATANLLRQNEFMQRKAEGKQNLYLACGALGAFLLMVFLSMLIKIERNLRYLEPIAARGVSRVPN
ncbi:MAG: hypothetical protein V4508_25660 [Pseudomonadota bacterium]